jgi:hypothetical protein
MRRGVAKVELRLTGRDGPAPQDNAGRDGPAPQDNAGRDGPAPQDNGGKSAWRIYRLSPSGRRLGEVPYTSGGSRPQGERTGDGAPSDTIAFTARTDLDPSTATYLYEIVRAPEE